MKLSMKTSKPIPPKNRIMLKGVERKSKWLAIAVAISLGLVFLIPILSFVVKLLYGVY